MSNTNENHSSKQDILLQVSPFDSDGGRLIGRHPADIPERDWIRSGLSFLIGLKAIRAKCRDCAHSASEIRNCVQSDCPLWPLRMGSIPKTYRNALRKSVSSELAASGGQGHEFDSPEENPTHSAESVAGGSN